MSHEPLISIIVPVYNVENYIFSCLQSLLQQSYEKIEIIIVNDGSTDNSLEICRDFQKRYLKQITVIDKRNEGLSSARNTGINHSKGDYIAFVDSDDVVHQNYISTLFKVIGEADISICSLKKFYRPELIEPRSSLDKWHIQTFSGDVANGLLYDEQKGLDMAVVTNKLFKKDIWKIFKFPEGRLHEDIAVIYRIFDYVKSVAYVDAELYFYRIRNNSITSARSLKSIADEYKALTEQFVFFSKKGHSLLARNANRARKSLFLLKSVDNNLQIWREYNILNVIADDLRTKMKIKLILKKINGKVLALFGSVQK